MEKTSMSVFLWAIAGLLFLPLDAQAYLDPGSGSAMLQLVAAGICTVAVFARQIRDLIGKLFRK